MKNSKFVICIDNSAYLASLEIRKIYEVVPDSDATKTHQVRVVDESGDTYLFPASCFIDAKLSKETRDAVAKVA